MIKRGDWASRTAYTDRESPFNLASERSAGLMLGAFRSRWEDAGPAPASADFPAVIELADLDGTNGLRFRVDGADSGSSAGRSLSSAGDVNGDGVDDIIIGASGANPGGLSQAGSSYVVFGQTGASPAQFDLSTLDGTNGFRLDGTGEGNFAGYSVSGAGDVNGDGFDDVVIGAIRADADGDTDAGKSYVVFGKAGGFDAVIDLATLDGTDGFRLDGDDAREYSGWSVSGAGDVNGDGFDDILIGAPESNPRTGRDAGSTYLVYGKADGFAPIIDLVSLEGTDGFRFIGLDAGDESGISVSGAGDVNGDGFDDIVIGASGADVGAATVAGVTYVVFGSADGFAPDFTFADLDGTNGFRIRGVAQFDRSGLSVSSAGDVNGDGFDDIVIGAQYAGPDGKMFAGQSYVVFGQADGFAASVDLAALDGTDGFRLDGLDQGDGSGCSVSSAGDINGDGFDDIVIGAYRADPGPQGAGETYVVFGKAGGFGESVDLAALDGTDGFRVEGIGFVDYSGVAVSSAGDVNGDGFDDILIGSINAGNNDESYLIYGRAPTGPVTRIGSAADQTIRGGDFDDFLRGRRGDDVLAGGAGRDDLNGGRGADDYLLASRDPADADRIFDFGRGGDEIALDGDVFGLPEGALAAKRFVIGTAAADANDRLIYDDATGELFFDTDGTGAQAQVLIATLTDAPTLAASDIIVV